MELALSTRDQLIAEADAADGLECCGVLLADGTALPCANIAEHKHHRFAIDPLTLLKLDREHEIVGIYHSHPDAPPIPSATDLAAAWAGYVYVIVGRVENAWALRGWQINGDAFTEVSLHFSSNPIGD